MAKKYHIDAHGKVVPCQAFLRKCPRTDYSSQEAAYSALYIQEEGNRLAEARAEVEKVMSDISANSDFISADFSGDNHGKSVREFAKSLDEKFFQDGEYPVTLFADIQLNRETVDNRNTPISLHLRRMPVANYDEGVIAGQWRLETEIKNGNNPEPIMLELEDDYENARDKAESRIRDVVIRTSPRNFTTAQIEYETNHLLNQVDDAFAQIEEEASGPYKVWEKNNEIGSFAGSDMFNINVDVDYNTTLFRGRTFERFLNEEDGHYTSVAPELNIQVYDNENGKSETSWRVVRYQGDWYLQTVDETGQPNPQKVKNAEDAYNRMYNFVTNHMRTNSSTVAEEKAQYVANLIVDVEQAIKINGEIKDRRASARSTKQKTAQEKDSHRKLFGNSPSSTMDNILDMYV